MKQPSLALSNVTLFQTIFRFNIPSPRTLASLVNETSAQKWNTALAGAHLAQRQEEGNVTQADSEQKHQMRKKLRG